MPSNTTPEAKKAAKAAKLAEQLKLFESLPPYALVALPVVSCSGGATAGWPTCCTICKTST